MKFLVINGPNLNLLGKRNESFYGNLSLEKIKSLILSEYPSDEFSFFQSNDESEICSSIQDSMTDGIILNPGAFTHTSIAIRDAIESKNTPIIEVHLSNISARDNFRKTQLTSPKTEGYISGFKENSYLAGIYLLKKLIEKKANEGER